MIKRIFRMLGALGTGLGVTLIAQFLLPPAFLHYYGVRRFGDWLVLSGTLSYLYTLSFGITTYASNELTMLHKRGEMKRYHEVQHSTLALLLGMISFGCLLSSTFFLMPLTRMLHLSTISPAEARLTAFFLGLQAMSHILGGYFNDLYLIIEETHRGLLWYNARRLSATIISLPLIALQLQFSTIAIGQLVAVVVVTLLTIFDLKRRMGNLLLGPRGADWKTTKEIAGPSGLFAMIFLQQFLIFQAPVILLEWIAGSAAVVVFSISRTLFSCARQMLQTITTAIAPEITFSFAKEDTSKLLKIFHSSERLVFALTPVANLGTLLISPILLDVWLHKSGMFDPAVYSLMALISGVMCMRDHKQFFQFATNRHKGLSMIVFFGNITMLCVSVPFTIKLGVIGFLVVWLISETSQMVFLYYENKKLFQDDQSLTSIPAIKLIAVMLVALPLCAGLLRYTQNFPVGTLGVISLAGVTAIAIASYFVFDVRDVWNTLWSRRLS